MRKKIVITMLVILAILIITNPTNSDFKSFVEGKTEQNTTKVGCGRTTYLGIVSIYESNVRRYGDNDDEHNKYVGILKNFISVNP